MLGIFWVLSVFILCLGLWFCNKAKRLLAISKEAPAPKNKSYSEDIVALKIRLYEKLEEQFQEKTKALNDSLKKIEKDIETARKIQYSTLPNPETLPLLEIGSLYMPLSEVSGDIYDYFEIEKDVYRLMIADATGHGVQAGFLTMSIRTEYERIKYEISDPALIIQKLNESIFKTFHNGGFFYTCIVMDFSFEKQFANYCSAGHPPFLFFETNRASIQEANGPVIGIDRSISYSTQSYPLKKNTQLVLFTDGIFEFNQEQKEGIWGFEEFVHLVTKYANLRGQSLCNEILQEVASILSDKGFQDDITFLAIANKN